MACTYVPDIDLYVSCWTRTSRGSLRPPKRPSKARNGQKDRFFWSRPKIVGQPDIFNCFTCFMAENINVPSRQTQKWHWNGLNIKKCHETTKITFDSYCETPCIFCPLGEESCLLWRNAFVRQTPQVGQIARSCLDLANLSAAHLCPLFLPIPPYLTRHLLPPLPGRRLQPLFSSQAWYRPSWLFTSSPTFTRFHILQTALHKEGAALWKSHWSGSGMITASSTARTSIQLLMELHLAHDLISSIAVIGGFHEPSSCFGG